MGKIKNLLHNKWVRFHAGRIALYALVRGLDGQPLDAAGTAGHLRPLHHEILLPLRVEPQREDVPAQHNLQDGLRVGQRHHLRDGRGDAGAHLRLPDVRHPHLVDGTDAAHRRLPLREQGGLRTADAQHAAVVPLRTPHDALLADQEIVLRGDQVAPTTVSRDSSRSAATTWWCSTSRRATRCCSKTRT